MGMFDNVDVRGGVVKCPSCGHGIDDHWQTKEGKRTLAWLPWYNCDMFYTDCDECHELVIVFRDHLIESDDCAARYRTFSLSFMETQTTAHRENAPLVTWLRPPRTYSEQEGQMFQMFCEAMRDACHGLGEYRAFDVSLFEWAFDVPAWRVAFFDYITNLIFEVVNAVVFKPDGLYFGFSEKGATTWSRVCQWPNMRPTMCLEMFIQWQDWMDREARKQRHEFGGKCLPRWCKGQLELLDDDLDFTLLYEESSFALDGLVLPDGVFWATDPCDLCDFISLEPGIDLTNLYRGMAKLVSRGCAEKILFFVHESGSVFYVIQGGDTDPTLCLDYFCPKGPVANWAGRVAHFVTVRSLRNPLKSSRAVTPVNGMMTLIMPCAGFQDSPRLLTRFHVDQFKWECIVLNFDRSHEGDQVNVQCRASSPLARLDEQDVRWPDLSCQRLVLEAGHTPFVGIEGHLSTVDGFGDALMCAINSLDPEHDRWRRFPLFDSVHVITPAGDEDVIIPGPPRVLCPETRTIEQMGEDKDFYPGVEDHPGAISFYHRHQNIRVDMEIMDAYDPGILCSICKVAFDPMYDDETVCPHCYDDINQ